MQQDLCLGGDGLGIERRAVNMLAETLPTKLYSHPFAAFHNLLVMMTLESHAKKKKRKKEKVQKSPLEYLPHRKETISRKFERRKCQNNYQP